MARAKSSTNQDNLNSGSYEERVAAIEKIITNIESGDLELADVFEQFTVAVENLRQCESFLKQRQEQVDLLIETLKDD